MTTIITGIAEINDIVEWLMVNYGSTEYNDSWSMPTSIRDELPMPPELAVFVAKHDPTFKYLGTPKASLNINNDHLAALVKLKFSDIIYKL